MTRAGKAHTAIETSSHHIDGGPQSPGLGLQLQAASGPAIGRSLWRLVVSSGFFSLLKNLLF